ncbi:transglutaminase domain-containing protein [Streptomyces caniscabiei]|uniref:Transglutaminase domain-containing protein n=1 Tax=Streptomyces caniscabiei TaxID=2746961 RepID=A0ABU4N1K1_9ACTN|nr:transglutaminase domain-containing protein [Streptomyces caniscabiei]MBE4736841.1 transglutaminase domain-containing protein [Streptomyces caniscabiei]MBE4762076.1 transglutaminase domain-containing protein [Streptomyces caniscabiei]MBE4775413.1 transglutaminase domain-containing protein [Streptomyces caniscabiei]MBE4787042.1 transglutaminase domain-containing protein [Streptomyces caniscabiei]MBE4794703.1 transglutaminase domain-containing protein [Streptomyces caniscabiei]
MTSRLLMSNNVQVKRAAVAVREPSGVVGSTQATAILDHDDPLVGALARRVLSEATPRDALRSAHRIIARDVRPVYSVEDCRRVSRTLRLGRGSCSQRMAALEAVARAVRVRTRVRGLLVDGTFWYPRFPRLKPFVPEQVLLAWPEFRISGAWVPIGELFDAPAAGGDGFANKGGETLFDAVARTGVRWDACGAEAGSGPGTACDLSARVVADLGHFDDRDELFTRHGQTLCWTARTLGEPLLGRWSAGATHPTA